LLIRIDRNCLFPFLLTWSPNLPTFLSFPQLDGLKEANLQSKGLVT
jgi:hypothetical protein